MNGTNPEDKLQLLHKKKIKPGLSLSASPNPRRSLIKTAMERNASNHSMTSIWAILSKSWLLTGSKSNDLI